jgi:exodeoxyribonuclease VII large subunit
MAARLAHNRTRVENGLAALVHLGPAQVLARGFSIVRDASGALVSDSTGMEIGQTLEVEFARGSASTRVEGVLP